MSLADVRYQDHAFRQVQRALAANRLPHAYLFHGPHGVGKETFANGLAQTLLCDAPEDVSSLSRACQQAEGGGSDGATEVRATNEGAGTSDEATKTCASVTGHRVACGKCKECELVHARTHPDLHVIFRQLNREHPDADVRKRKALIISVDVVREFIVKPIALKPTRGRIKVFLVREADRMNEQAQNALLKTLEEPPGSALLVLLVDSIDRMLPTTLSRCQVVRFDALPVAFVREKLEELVPGLDSDRAAWYARSSDGSLGATLERVEDEWYELNGQLLGDLPELATRRSDVITKQWLDSAKALGAKCRKRDPEMTETEAVRRGLNAVLQLCALWYADVLREMQGESSLVVNTASQTQIRKSSESFDAERCADAVARIARTERQLTLNANTQLCIETLVSDLARMARGETSLAGH